MQRYIHFFFSSRRRRTRWNCDWSSDVCSSDLPTSAPCAAADRSAAAQGALVGAAQASYLPRLSLGGSVGYAAPQEIGRASCRERVSLSQDAVPLCTKQRHSGDHASFILLAHLT